MTKQVRQAVVPTHIIGSTGDAEGSTIGYRTIGSFKDDLGLGTSLTNTTLAGQLNLGSTGQIVFPADQNASANANTLDDYEEGIWTPTITDGTNEASGYGSVRAGRYVKIGNRVFIWCAVAKNGSVGMTGANSAVITGLPFANRNVEVGWYTPLTCIAFNIDFPADANGIAGNVQGGATNIFVFFNRDNNTVSSLTVAQWGDGASNTINLSGYYETTA